MQIPVWIEKKFGILFLSGNSGQYPFFWRLDGAKEHMVEVLELNIGIF
jgi:hypothetical protein